MQVPTRKLLIGAALLAVPFGAGCGIVAGKSSACDSLPAKKSSLTRKQYLPCAGEMVAILDRVDDQVERMLRGDLHAKLQATDNVHQLSRLLNKAGGRDLLERWDDRALTTLNVNIWNSYTHHAACMMVAGQLFGKPPLGDEKKREPAKAECRAYRSSYADASRAYRRLK